MASRPASHELARPTAVRQRRDDATPFGVSFETSAFVTTLTRLLNDTVTFLKIAATYDEGNNVVGALLQYSLAANSLHQTRTFLQTIETDERRYLTEHVTIGDLVKPPVLLSSDLINMDRHALLGRWLFDEQQRCLHAVEILQLLYRRSVQPAPSAKSRDDKDTVDETACDRFQPIRFEPGTEECRLFFDTVVGMDDVKHQIRRGLIHPLVQPRLYPSTRLPNILLYGPPGTGKTHVMTAAANELQQTEGLRILVYSVTADQLKGAYFGESEKNIRALYDCASAAACRFQTPSTRVYAMVMIDEVDAVAPNRAVDNTGLAATTVNALLQTIDGVKRYDNLFTVAITNYPWQVDAAFFRRFPVRIPVFLPTKIDTYRIITRLFDEYIAETLSRKTRNLPQFCRDRKTAQQPKAAVTTLPPRCRRPGTFGIQPEDAETEKIGVVDVQDDVEATPMDVEARSNDEPEAAEGADGTGVTGGTGVTQATVDAAASTAAAAALDRAAAKAYVPKDELWSTKYRHYVGTHLTNHELIVIVEQLVAQHYSQSDVSQMMRNALMRMADEARIVNTFQRDPTDVGPQPLWVSTTRLPPKDVLLTTDSIRCLGRFAGYTGLELRQGTTMHKRFGRMQFYPRFTVQDPRLSEEMYIEIDANLIKHGIDVVVVLPVEYQVDGSGDETRRKVQLYLHSHVPKYTTVVETVGNWFRARKEIAVARHLQEHTTLEKLIENAYAVYGPDAESPTAGSMVSRSADVPHHGVLLQSGPMAEVRRKRLLEILEQRVVTVSKAYGDAVPLVALQVSITSNNPLMSVVELRTADDATAYRFAFGSWRYNPDRTELDELRLRQVTTMEPDPTVGELAVNFCLKPLHVELAMKDVRSSADVKLIEKLRAYVKDPSTY